MVFRVIMSGYFISGTEDQELFKVSLSVRLKQPEHLQEWVIQVSLITTLRESCQAACLPLGNLDLRI